MTMGMDPRTVAELWKLQMLSRVDWIGAGNTASNRDSGGDFVSMLRTLLAGATAASGTDAVRLAADRTGSYLQAAAAASAYRTGNPNGVRTADGKPAKPSPNAARYEPYISAAGSRYGVDAGLIKAVIHAESSFNPQAVSRAGAKGLMQLMDGTARGLGVTDPFDPLQNIDGGTRYLAGLLEKYNGNTGVALAAYNAGPGRIDRLGISDDAELTEKFDLLPKETQSYVRKVLALRQSYGV